MKFLKDLWNKIVSSNDEQYINKIAELEWIIKQKEESNLKLKDELLHLDNLLENEVANYIEMKRQFESMQKLKNELLEELDTYKKVEVPYTIPTDIIDTGKFGYLPSTLIYYYNQSTNKIATKQVQVTISKYYRMWDDNMYQFFRDAVKDCKTIDEKFIKLRDVIKNKVQYQHDVTSTGLQGENWRFPLETFYGEIGDCLMGDTPIVVNNNGYTDIIELSDLMPIDFPFYERYNPNISIFCGNDKKNKSSSLKFKPINWIVKKQTDKQIYRINSNKCIIDVTEDHKISCRGSDGLTNEWIEAKDLAKKKVKINKTYYNCFNNKQKYNLDYDIGWVYGLFSAEGYCGNSIWRIYNTDKQLLEKAKDILTNRVKKYRINNLRSLYFEIVLLKGFKKGDITNKSVRNKDLWVLQARAKKKGSLKKFVDIQRNMFYTNNKSKKVPASILNGSIEAKKGFIDGHYEGDKFCTVSKILAFGIITLFEIIGIDARLRDNGKNFVIDIVHNSYKKKTIGVKKINRDTNIVYDINVDYPHKFLAGNIYVHNCEDTTSLWVTACHICDLPADRFFNGTGHYKHPKGWIGHSFGLAKFKNDKWYVIETTSKRTPLLFKDNSEYKLTDNSILNGLSNAKMSGKSKKEQF